MDCKFCRDFDDLKQVVRKSPKVDGTNKRYKVQLCFTRTQNRRTVGFASFGLYDLRFCPVCGQKLNKR